MRVHDAVISSKLLYGLESASLTNAVYERLRRPISNKSFEENSGYKTFIPLTHKQRSGDAES